MTKPNGSAGAHREHDAADALLVHELTRRVRGRGLPASSHLAALRYLRNLEAELGLVQSLLADAWGEVDRSKDFRKFVRHADQAQQRLHRAIKKLADVRKIG
jgi:hypothetical protein